MQLPINAARLLRRLDDFAAIGATPDGGVDRQALTHADRQSRHRLAELGLSRGFQVFQDGAANLFIRREGRLNHMPPLLIGSHLDTQPTGGRFDGALGVLAAFEVLEALADSGRETALPIEVVAWTNEEGSRFTPGSMGSQAFVNRRMPPAATMATDGARLDDEICATLTALPQATVRPLGMEIGGYLELHIEQGPILERNGIPIGIVDAVQGTRWLQVEISGEAAHAGTTPLEARRDPMAATTAGLARLYGTIMQQDAAARFTVGRIAVEPGSINAIPATVSFAIDLRHPDEQRLAELEGEIARTLEQAAEKVGCMVRVERIFDMPPTQFSNLMRSAIERAAARSGLPTLPMISGAFHDALFINRVAPAGMIFVPCRKGLSHNAREFVEPEFCITGAQMLLDATLEAVEMIRTQPSGAHAEVAKTAASTA